MGTGHILNNGVTEGLAKRGVKEGSAQQKKGSFESVTQGGKGGSWIRERRGAGLTGEVGGGGKKGKGLLKMLLTVQTQFSEVSVL